MRILTSLVILMVFVAGCHCNQDSVSQVPESLTKRVLILTGNDYPGHKWKETAPVLAEALRADSRLTVDVVEDPNFLASPDLARYDSIVLHWMNWETPDPGPQGRANLERCVRQGSGLVLVHFACGAFQGWDQFVHLAGRVYDPELRPHDPHGPFEVEIADPTHPITQGLSNFTTVDELYTCLAGNPAIHVLATAQSKVDKLDYPIAFVLQYGQGKVFHCVLGHDVKSLVNPPVAELFRRATAWTANLPPEPSNP